jgi:Spy/CpxP family protein refolding chaperone
MTRARATLLLVGMFALGLACGALGAATYGLHRLHDGGFSGERMEGFIVRRLARRLDLDNSQRQVLESVTRKAHARLREVHDDVLPRVEAIFDEAYQEMIPVLRADQIKEMEKIRTEARERLRRRHANP